MAVGIIAAVLALAVAWVLFVPAADWLAHHDVGSAKPALLQTARDAARGRLLTLGAGLVAAAALIFTALNFNLLRRTSEKNDEWQRRTHELSEQGQVTDRYTKAVEQLGSGKLDVCIGGIYALERIAHDSARDHPTVMEVLSAFIREHSREPWSPPDLSGQERARSTRPDVQAAVTVVGRRDKECDTRTISLTGADLSGADLRFAELPGADLRNVTLSRANLFGADLSRANLGGAKLGGVFLANARLSGASLFRADLSGANLTEADLSRTVASHADFTGADLTRTNFADARLREAMWPSGTPVPQGWKRDAVSGRLKRAETGPGPAEAENPPGSVAQEGGSSE